MARLSWIGHLPISSFPQGTLFAGAHNAAILAVYLYVDEHKADINREQITASKSRDEGGGRSLRQKAKGTRQK
jgi:hypothetical protein